MKLDLFLCFVLGSISLRLSESKKGTTLRSTKPYKEPQRLPKFDNPNFIRDRYRYDIYKPEMDPEIFSYLHRPFHPAWQDYCDPYHCNDYHKLACGLNRKTMRFRWFQSACHIILNNECAAFRGHLKYDWVEQKFCYGYVMQMRSHCPSACPTTALPVCGRSTVDGHTALFLNHCALERKNCDPAGIVDEYDEVDGAICEKYLNRTVSHVQRDLLDK